MVPLDLNDAERGVLHGQCPQVAVHAQGQRLPARPARPPATAFVRWSSRTAPTRRATTARASGSSSTGAAPAIQRHTCPSRRHSSSWVACCPAGGRSSRRQIGAVRSAVAQKLLAALGTDQPLAPESMIGALAAVELPSSDVSLRRAGRPADDDATYPLDPLHDALFDEDRIEVPVYPWPHTPG